MPPLLALIPAIVGAAGLGISGYELANRPGTPKSPLGPTVTPTQAGQTRAQQETALSGALPGLQAQVGGSLSPDALLRLAEIVSGQGGSPGIGSAVQDLLQKQFNVTAGGSTGTPAAPGAPGLTPGGTPYA